MYSVKIISCLFTLMMLSGCGNNLLPSGEDKRPSVLSGTTGAGVSQKAPVFTVSDTGNNSVTLTNALVGRKGIVLYFTMWCPICDSHMNNMRTAVAPLFPNVGFYLVDYVSGSVADAAAAAASNGYSGGVYTTIVDAGQLMLNSYQATMGTAVVIDSGGTIRMNEDYRDGKNLLSALAALP